MHRDVPAHHLRQLAAAVSAGEPEEQDRGVAAFEDLIGPASASFSGGPDEEFDVIDEERIAWSAGSVPRGGVLTPNPRQSRGDQFVRGRREMPGYGVLMVDRGDPRAEGGNGLGPLSCFGSGVGGIDEIRGNSDGVRRQRHVTVRFAPASEGPRRSCAYDSTALTLRFAKAGGILADSNDLPPTVPSTVLTAGARPGRKSMEAA